METVIRPENEMIDSGIEWIGEIPDNWKLVKVKNLFYIGRGRVISKLVLENSGYPVYSSQTKNNGCLGYISTYDFDRSQLTWTTDGANAGTVFLREGKHNCTNVCGTLMPKDENNNLRFMKYSLGFIAVYHKRADINGYKIMNNEMAEIKITLPPLSEQQVIADYLDEKCSKIDDIIAEAKASIEEYKELKQAVIDNATMTGIHDSEMKDTDYVWFPEMPKNWDLVLASLLFREDVRPVDANDVSLSLSQVDGLIPTDDMSERSLKSATHDNWKHVIPDDLVLNRFKGHLGVFFASKYTGMVSFHYGVYHAIRDNVYAKYYEYLFHSTTYKNIFALKSNGITVGLQNLSNGNFYSVKILHPTLDEQIEIVKYLDKRTAEIDSLIAEKESLIKDLESYKKSLIYEVVTGKRRVV
jgi:type I restriction enzyme S subunit